MAPKLNHWFCPAGTSFVRIAPVLSGWHQFCPAGTSSVHLAPVLSIWHQFYLAGTRSVQLAPVPIVLTNKWNRYQQACGGQTVVEFGSHLNSYIQICSYLWHMMLIFVSADTLYKCL